ncbi:MAG: endolytic transglycosylase MltG, partial [Clostridiales bacterium]|nr:endolytic transglycosylase MltG [Clostridiales bacterium]
NSTAVTRENGKTEGRLKKLKGKNGTVTSTYLFFIIVIAVSMIISIYAVFCLNDIFGITKSQSSVTVNYTEQIDNTSDAIDVLADYGLIRCKNFCKLYVKLASAVVGDYDVSPPFEAGVYYLNGKMGLEGMLINMMGNPETSETVKITFPEGYTTADIINKLVENEVCDKAALLSVIESTDFSYSLVSGLTSKETVPYRLEGYLFPNTYNFYVGQSASSVIETFLQETEKEITQEDRNRAKELGYSMQEIITIASIVQAEAGSDEQMSTIAAVIENRLKDTTNYPTIDCQSTSDYITKRISSSLSSTSAHTADYYLQYYNTNSTSNVVGLPEGPICNPGKAAIQAALYPEDINDFYFFHDSNGNLYTAETYSEFKSKVQKYAPYLSY